MRASGSLLLHILGWMPHRVRKEFKTRGGDARFLMWVSFLLAFIWIRFFILYLADHHPTLAYEDQFQWGSQVVIFGYHPHHIAFGVLLLSVAGWLGIHYAGKQVTRVAAVLYGVGLGLIVDEVAFIVEGIGPYTQDDPEVFVLAVVVAGFLMSTVYFRSFWDAVGRRFVRVVWPPSRHRVPLRLPPLPEDPTVPESPMASRDDEGPPSP